jgi:hypothetical protein
MLRTCAVDDHMFRSGCVGCFSNGFLVTWITGTDEVLNFFLFFSKKVSILLGWLG